MFCSQASAKSWICSQLMWWQHWLALVTHTPSRPSLRGRDWVTCWFSVTTSAGVMVPVLAQWRRFQNSGSSCCRICSSRMITFLKRCQISWSRAAEVNYGSRLCQSGCPWTGGNWWKSPINTTIGRAPKIAVESWWRARVLLHCLLIVDSNVKLIMLTSSMIIMLFPFHRECTCELMFW